VGWGGAIGGLVTAAAIAVGVLVWRLVGAGAEHATRAQVDELMAELNRASSLARELEKERGTERQLLRFKSYGQLWARLRALAIYDETPIDTSEMARLSKQLSDWYFSETGGLLLTAHNRELYFALQDLVSKVGAKPGWKAERTGEPKEVFAAVLQDLPAAKLLVERLDERDVSKWPSHDLEQLARGYRKDVRKLVGRWEELREEQRFAVLQQVASLLRTGLTRDVESRLR
jgi:hypothetical protein